MAQNTMGQFLAALRKASGMTQQDVADRMHVSNKAVSRWERDESAPDISTIPALAELFGVTCDELLRGERSREASPEPGSARTARQVKYLLRRTLSGFQTLCYIALALAAVGAICMFGITFGFARPVVGFAVMLLCETGALVLTILAVSRTMDVKQDSELLEQADAAQTEHFHKVLGTLSFCAFYAVLAAVLLSLPLALVNYAAGSSLNTLFDLTGYLVYFYAILAAALVLVWLRWKAPYMAWITGRTLDDVPDAVRDVRRRMHLVQLGLLGAAAILIVVAPYAYQIRDVTRHMYTIYAIAFAVLAASMVSFAVMLCRHKAHRRHLLLPGIRNICLIPTAFFLIDWHDTVWLLSDIKRYDFWDTRYLLYAVAYCVAVCVVFAIVEYLTQRKKRRAVQTTPPGNE